MPLTALWKSSPESISQFSIEQVVATAGDGVLKDGSVCSEELTRYLKEVEASKLADYVEHCLSNSFPKSGFVLQDLVNELGRRLDYKVANGLYQGRTGGNGFDGLWNAPEGNKIIVEVKTSDAYRVSLDAIIRYRQLLQESGDIGQGSSVLIVVGRQDTGELEAQVRGSRHAWDIRLISAEALLKLVQLKENSDDVETGQKIRSLLTPLEYTRLDRLVDVVFTTATDIEVGERESEDDNIADRNSDDASGASKSESPIRKMREKGVWEFTDSVLLQKKRESIIQALAENLDTRLIKKSRALYWSADHSVRVACSLSKRYTKRRAYPYWYAFHAQWDEFLIDADDGYFCLGCMDLPVAFSIPSNIIHDALTALNTTKTTKGLYWHIHVVENGSGAYSLLLPKAARNLSLTQYQIAVPEAGIATAPPSRQPGRPLT